MQIKNYDRVTLVGQTGSGKTYAARKLTSGLRRLIVLDAKDELRDWNTRLADLKSIERALNKEQAFRLRWLPEPGDSASYERLFESVYYAGGPVTLYIDELTDAVAHGTRAGPFLAALYQRGRGLGIGVWASTQRPAWVPLFTLSEATWLFIFRLRLVVDRERMAGLAGDDVLTRITDRYGFWLMRQDWERPRYFHKLN